MNGSRKHMGLATLPAAASLLALLASPAVQADDAAMALARKSGCFACHNIEKKVVGPAWRDVSKRYLGDEGARARLIKKVHTGGKGNWTKVTGGVPMPPYSPRVSDADIETLVDFVLSLAKSK